MTTKILAFSGQIGSGKSSLAGAISEKLRWKLGSFGDFVRQEAHKRGINSESRWALQELGMLLVTTNLGGFCAGFLRSIAYSPGENLVLDGIRHEVVLKTIREQTNATWVRLVHVVADATVRKRRHSIRGLEEGLTTSESHPVEREEQLLAQRADFLLDTTDLATSEATSRVQAWVSKELSS